MLMDWRSRQAQIILASSGSLVYTLWVRDQTIESRLCHSTHDLTVAPAHSFPPNNFRPLQFAIADYFCQMFLGDGANIYAPGCQPGSMVSGYSMVHLAAHLC